ncbi:MAG: magnesium transporter [Gammaproteobacteria bacterium]|nr:MAG: magnesium transporter [Gammaproteobacteria bacterium]
MDNELRTDTGQEVLSTLSDALDSGKLNPVSELLKSLNGAEIAHLLESLPPQRRLIVWKLVDADNEGEVLVSVNEEVRASLIREMEAGALIAATGSLELDDLADILDDLPDTVTRQILDSMDKENRERLATVLSYPEDSAGGLMNTDVITVRRDVSLDVVLRYLRKLGEIPEHTDYLFVVDRDGRYVGRLSLTDVVTRDLGLLVADAMDTSVEGIPTTMEDNDVAALFERRDLVSAPVVDDNNMLLGRITVDDVLDVVREEGEHSVLSLAGLDEEDDMFAPVVTSVVRRGWWLGINLLTALLAAWVITRFEATIAQVVALAVLMPVVASMGGIAGGQTLVLMIRGIAVGQVGPGNAQALLTKEVAVALLNGILWALVVGGVAILWYDEFSLGAVVALAIAVNLMAGALAGVIIPLVMQRLNIDPALAGNVVLTTVTDVIGFSVLLGLGTIFLIK